MDQVKFVPVSDELLFDHPERIRGPLVPYCPGMSIQIDPGDEPSVNQRTSRGLSSTDSLDSKHHAQDSKG